MASPFLRTVSIAFALGGYKVGASVLIKRLDALDPKVQVLNAVSSEAEEVDAT